MIELRGVSRTVQSGGAPLTILHPLELFVPAGQSLAITGPSGSGKSTLLGLIAGLDAPTSGAIVIDGVDITRLGEDALARLRGDKIGFVFQFFHLIPSLTARENVLVPMELAGRRDAARRADALLDEVGLRDRGHHYPSQLSGGEQQRVAIARALANDPPILLADEPTGNLDSANGRHIMDLLVDVNRARKTTLVLVTHDAGLAAEACRAAGPARWPARFRALAARATGAPRMMFVLRMAIRETRSSWQRLLFFFVCLAIGVGAIVTLRSVIQSVRGVVTGEARTLIAGDVVISTGRGWSDQDRALLASWLAPDRGVQATTVIARDCDDGAAGRPGQSHGTHGRTARRRSGLSALRARPAARQPDLLACAAGGPRRAGEAGAADAAGSRRGRRAHHRLADVHDSGRARRRAWQPQRRIQSWSTRPDRSRGARAGRAIGIRQPRAASDHAARGPGAPRRLHARGPAGLSQRVRQCAFVEEHRKRHRRRPRALRELSEPGGPGRAGAGRHRRVERHARLRRAEAQEHRGAEVRRRPHRADPRRLHAPGAGAGPGRQPARRCAGARRPGRGHAICGQHVADRRAVDLRLDMAGSGAGRADRLARGAAVFDRAPAARSPRAALVAVASGGRGRWARLSAIRRRRAGRRGAGRGGRLAGGLVARRPHRLRWASSASPARCGAPAGCW